MGIDAELLIRVKGSPSDDDLKRWSWQIAESLGAGKFFINADRGEMAIARTDSRYRDEFSPPPGTIYSQDGPDIIAEPGETLLEVSLCSRYYGIGYERGDLLTICAVAEWCEANIPDCAVWYGGDSSGVCAEPFPEEARAQLRRHLYTRSGRDYFKHDAWAGAEFKPDVSDCRLCIPEGRLSQFGAGGGFAAWACAGCGRNFETRDAGKTWVVKKS